MNATSNSALAWLLTYAIHSTVLLGMAWGLSRRAVRTPSARDFMWKVALVGGIVTSTVQIQAGVRPSGSLALAPSARDQQPTGESRAAPGEATRVTSEPDLTKTPSPSTTASASASTNGSSTSASSDLSSLATTTVSGSIAASSSAAIAVWAWAVAALLLSVGYLARRLILVGRLGDRRAVIEGPLPAMLGALREASGHRGLVRLTSSSAISSPVALGLGEICVPEAALTDLDADQQRGLLAHELAHLTRRDPLWLDAASLLERVFFFQPLNRLARRELQQAAEYLCDDWAAARTGSGVPLAKCLARVAEWIQASPLGVPVAGMAEQRSLLVARIARLIEGRAAASPAPRLVLTSAALVLLGAVVAAAPGVQGRPPAGVGAQAGTSPDSGTPPAGAPVADAPRGDVPRGLGPVFRGLRTSALLRPPAAKLDGPFHLTGAPHLGRNSAEEAPVDSAVVYALMERLKDTDAGVRRAAASSLGNLRSRLAVPALIAALADRDREVRAAAAGALGDIQDDRAIGPLTELMSDQSSDVREHALDALANFAKDVNAGPVVHLLYDQRADVRQKAAHLLGEIGDRAAVGPLAGLLKDASTDVRETVLRALSEIKDPSVASAVTSALKDEYADVRHAALDALHEMKVPISEGTMLLMLRDPSPDVRQAAIQIVSDRPFPDAVPVLRSLLEDPNSDVRVEAVSALGEIGDPAARDALRAALKSKDAKVRKRAAEVLGERR